MYKRTILYVAAALVGTGLAFLLGTMFAVVDVTGDGMEPVLKNGAKVVVCRNVDLKDMSHTGSLVAFRNQVHGEDGEGSVLIRRVAAAEGDKVEIKESILYVNGRPYTDYMTEAVHMDDMDRINLKKGQLFLMSDNRKSSMDSRNRAIGIVREKDCIGKVLIMER